MGRDRAGGWALILGALTAIVLMAVHPSHVGQGPRFGALSLNAVVHGAALVAMPTLLFGFWRFTRAQKGRALAELALAFFALSAAATVVAATLSGLVIPAIVAAGHGHAGHMRLPTDPEALRQQLQAAANMTVWLNRAFAAVHVGLFAVAMLLWCVAWNGRDVLAWIGRGVGVLAGLGVLAWAFSGTMTLDAQHGALLATLVQGVWVLLVGAWLVSGKREG